MKAKFLLLLIALAMLALPALAEEAPTAYWQPDPNHAIECVNNLDGCQVLQMVMTGSFDGFTPDDSLSGRILSAALPKLCAVTESDIAHFLQYFDVNEGTLRRYYYIALANCLWADIRLGLDPGGTVSAVRRVLLLFLDPASETDAQAQMETIRSRTDDAMIETMADAIGMPGDFLRYLIFSADWHDASAEISIAQ